MSDLLSPGFADPVADAQSCFRAVLAAMSQPGSVHGVSGVDAPPPLGNALAAVLLTLVDQETPVWLDAELDAARTWVAFHTGAASAAIDAARFAVAAELPALDSLASGTDESPESAATVVLQVAALGSGQRFELSGPGLRAPTVFLVDGLPSDFLGQRGDIPMILQKHSDYP